MLPWLLLLLFTAKCTSQTTLAKWVNTAPRPMSTNRPCAFATIESSLLTPSTAVILAQRDIDLHYQPLLYPHSHTKPSPNTGIIALPYVFFFIFLFFYNSTFSRSHFPTSAKLFKPMQQIFLSKPTYLYVIAVCLCSLQALASL